MSNNHFSKESSELINKIRKLEFVKNARIKGNSVPVNCRNYENSLIFNKNDLLYIASLRISGQKYKIEIEIQGNRPNPKYEKQIKKLF